MSDERFFAQVKSSVHDYQPAVPESVYAGMRKKLWWSNFTRLSFSRFNMYYLLVLIGGASAFFFLRQDTNNMSCVAPAPAVIQPATSANVNHVAAADYTTAPSSSAVNEVHQQSTAAVSAPISKAHAQHAGQHTITAVPTESVKVDATPAVVQPIANPAAEKSTELSASTVAPNTTEQSSQPANPGLKTKAWKVSFPQDKKNAPKN